MDVKAVEEWRQKLKAGVVVAGVLTEGVTHKMFDDRSTKLTENGQDFKYLSSKDQDQLSSLLQMFTSRGDVQVRFVECVRFSRHTCWVIRTSASVFKIK